MGTLLALSFPAADTGARWAETAFAVATACERVMSRHDPDSDLSRVNRLAGRSRLLRSPALATTLRAARAWAARTEGGFDPTVAPLLDAWRAGRGRGTPGARSRVQDARRRVGWPGIIVRDDRVGLARRGAALDLGAFGKGVALDRITRALRRQRCPAALLNFGESSLAAIGRAPSGGWRVLLRHPAGGFLGEFRLRDGACSTSGTRGRTWGRRRVSHVVDPRSGQPLRGAAQVTVLARSAAKAEALSTALLVLGRPALEATARRFGVEVCWIDAAGLWLSPGFPLTRHPGP